MTKYKIVKESKALPEGYRVGYTIVQNTYDKDNWNINSGECGWKISWEHLQALLELGVVEEVKEWNPSELKDGDDYYVYDFHEKEAIHYCWFYDRTPEWHLFNRHTKNCHPTKEAAEAWGDKLLADYK